MSRPALLLSSRGTAMRRGSSFRPCLEALEVRLTPTVSASYDPLTQCLNVTLNQAGDAATLTGTAAATVGVAGTNYAGPASFTQVNNIKVSGSQASQSLLFNSASLNSFAISGTLDISGIA